MMMMMMPWALALRALLTCKVVGIGLFDVISDGGLVNSVVVFDFRRT